MILRAFRFVYRRRIVIADRLDFSSLATLDCRLYLITPPALADAWRSVEKAEDVTPALLAWDQETYLTGAPATLRPLT